MSKISALPEDTLPTVDDFLVAVDTGSSTTKKVKLSNFATALSSIIRPLVYPVGCIYIETTGTNPGTSFGFGTWVAYAQGNALVGINSSGTFNVAPGTVVGEEKHTMTNDELVSHAHGVYDPGHDHRSTRSGETVFTAGSTNKLSLSGSAQQVTWGADRTDYSGTGIGIYASGNSVPFNVIQPSVAVYVWKRTA